MPNLLDNSTFEVAWISHIKDNDNRGKERWLGMPSAELLTFPLEDFVQRGETLLSKSWIKRPAWGR